MLRAREFVETDHGFDEGDWNTNINQVPPVLGEEGWELAAVSPRSSDARRNMAVATTDELWVFKRPKS